MSPRRGFVQTVNFSDGLHPSLTDAALSGLECGMKFLLLLGVSSTCSHGVILDVKGNCIENLVSSTYLIRVIQQLRLT